MAKYLKVMRWGDERAFALIQWILALLDDQVIPFDFIDVTSGNKRKAIAFMRLLRVT